MKKLYFMALLALLANVSFGQQKMRVHNSGNIMYAKEITAVDSIKLDNSYAKFKTADAASVLNIQKVFIDSITFATTAINLDKIYIIYNGTDNATIINPYANAGVNITANAGTVTVNAASGIANLEYNILGASANGSLTMTTDQDLILALNNLTLTNPGGAAFAISGSKATAITLKNTSTLSDGSASTKNGTITTDGPISIAGTGSLALSGIKKHGISTSSAISILGGTTTVLSAASDALHSEGFSMSAGTVTLTTPVADGVDAGNAAIAISGGTLNVTSTSTDVKALKTGTNTITITGGNVTISVSGAQSKGISAKGNIVISDGTIAVTISGATVLTALDSGFDPSNASAIKTDAEIQISGGTFNVQSLAAADGGKAFSADGNIVITGGTFTVSTAGNGGTYVNAAGVADSFSTSGFTSDADIAISGGTFTLINSGSDGKAIAADANVTISGTAQISIANSGNSGKGIKATGNVTFAGGTTTVALSGATVLKASGSGFDPSYPTGIKADGNVMMNGGSLTVQASTAAKGAKGISSDGAITQNGGTINVTNGGAGQTYTNSTGALDSYSAACLSADTDIAINAGTVTTTSSGSGGKGIKADGTVTIGTATTSPTINVTTTGARFLVSGTDYSHPKTLVAAGAITINNGTNTFTSTDDGIHSDASVTVNGGNTAVSAISSTQGVGEGVEAPIITFNGGVTNITASNDGINATYGTVSGGTESNDGSQLNITGGIVIVAGSDAIDSNGNITISGGTTIVTGPTNQPEEGIDFNGTFLMNGGLLISGGSNSNMTKAMGTASAQVSLYLKSGSQLAATSLLHIQNAAGTDIVTFKPKNAVYYFHFSSPSLAQSTQYKVYFGGTYTGGSYVGGTTTWGLYTGGTYSATGGTLKSTFTTSATAKVNTVTF